MPPLPVLTSLDLLCDVVLYESRPRKRAEPRHDGLVVVERHRFVSIDEQPREARLVRRVCLRRPVRSDVPVTQDSLDRLHQLPRVLGVLLRGASFNASQDVLFFGHLSRASHASNAFPKAASISASRPVTRRPIGVFWCSSFRLVSCTVHSPPRQEILERRPSDFRWASMRSSVSSERGGKPGMGCETFAAPHPSGHGAMWPCTHTGKRPTMEFTSPP